MRMFGRLLPVLLLSAASQGAWTEPPLPPVSCSASDSLCGRVVVAWEKPEGSVAIDRYVVRRDGDSLGVVSPGPSETTFTLRDEAAAPNVSHAYAVLSWNAEGYSASACEDPGTRLTAPGAPLGFTASRNLCEAVRLAWQPPATGGPVWKYRIVRSTPPGWSIDVAADSREYFDAPGVSPVVYSIRAVNCEESAPDTNTGRAFYSPPPAPSACSATVVSCDSVLISWSPAGVADFGFVVLRGDGTLVDSVGPQAVSAGAGGVASGTDVSFRVHAVNACGRSGSGCTTAARIPGPIGQPPAGACAASTDSCAGVRVSWTWAPADAEWFRVVRVDDGSLLDSVGAGARSVFDASVAQGDTVTYSIRAGNRCFVSEGSCTVSGIRPPIPSAPQQCAATNGLCDRIRVTWYWPYEYLNQDIQGFRIYRRRSDQPSAPTDTFTVPPQISTVSWDDTSVNIGVNYIYTVSAFAKCGETSGGCQSTGIAPTAPGTAALFSPPNGAMDLELPVRLVWRTRARATTYRLEVATDAAFAETFVDTSLADTSYTVARLDTLGLFRWRVRAGNACGFGAPSAPRTFTVSSVPGLAVVSGSTSFRFGNGSDTLFTDSVFVLENRWPGYLTWVAGDTLSWVDFVPPIGSLAPGERESVTVSIRSYRCGGAYDDSVFIETDPVPPGHGPIGFHVSLAPPPRPVGDVDWDCEARAADAARIIEALLGDFLETEAESLGADANADGRITVADAVFLGHRLLEEAPAGPESEGTFSLAFAAGDEPVLEISAGFPLRAVRLFLQASPGDLSLAPVDAAHTLLWSEPSTGAVRLFWFSDESNPAWSAPVLRLAPAAASSGLEVRWIELAGSGGESVRMSGAGGPVLPAPPPRLRIGDVRPNPFNALATISFAVPEGARARITVHDVRGALVRTLLDGPVGAGWREVSWAGDTDAGRAAASGAYFIRLDWRGESVTRRALLVR